MFADMLVGFELLLVGSAGAPVGFQNVPDRIIVQIVFVGELLQVGVMYVLSVYNIQSLLVCDTLVEFFL